jgi:hypothetical protein
MVDLLICDINSICVDVLIDTYYYVILVYMF